MSVWQGRRAGYDRAAASDEAETTSEDASEASGGGGGGWRGDLAAGSSGTARPPAPLEPGCLPLSPSFSFAARYRAKSASISAGFDLFSLAIALTSAWRHGEQAPIPPVGLAYLLTLGGVAAANLLAYLAGGRPRAAYVAWLEVTAAFMRTQLFGMAFGGSGWVLTRRLLDNPPVPAAAVGGGRLLTAGQRASHVTLLLFAGGAVPILHVTLCRPMRLWLSVATQVALVANSVSWAGHMCTAQQLAAPAARAHTRALFALLSPLSHVSPLPVFSLGGVEPPAAEVQCATLLRFSQLVCGLAALVWQAATQARLHAAHQQQRREAGLPPERGASARILGILGELFADPLVRLQRWLAAALAVGLCWQLALAVGLQEEAA